jgi:hypothetical protein
MQSISKQPIIDKCCKDCKVIKPLNEFYKGKNKVDGRASYCKQCTILRSQVRKQNTLRKEGKNTQGFNPKIMIQRAKNRSINKGLDFDLDYKWVCSQLKNNVCPVTKLPFYLGKEPRHPMTPSIDKIDPNKGYTKNNCRVICYWYNTAKSNYSEEIVMSLCEAVVKSK